MTTGVVELIDFHTEGNGVSRNAFVPARPSKYRETLQERFDRWMQETDLELKTLEQEASETLDKLAELAIEDYDAKTGALGFLTANNRQIEDAIETMRDIIDRLAALSRPKGW